MITKEEKTGKMAETKLSWKVGEDEPFVSYDSKDPFTVRVNHIVTPMYRYLVSMDPAQRDAIMNKLREVDRVLQVLDYSQKSLHTIALEFQAVKSADLKGKRWTVRDMMNLMFGETAANDLSDATLNKTVREVAQSKDGYTRSPFTTTTTSSAAAKLITKQTNVVEQLQEEKSQDPVVQEQAEPTEEKTTGSAQNETLDKVKNGPNANPSLKRALKASDNGVPSALSNPLEPPTDQVDLEDVTIDLGRIAPPLPSNEPLGSSTDTSTPLESKGVKRGSPENSVSVNEYIQQARLQTVPTLPLLYACLSVMLRYADKPGPTRFDPQEITRDDVVRLWNDLPRTGMSFNFQTDDPFTALVVLLGNTEEERKQAFTAIAEQAERESTDGAIPINLTQNRLLWDEFTRIIDSLIGTIGASLDLDNPGVPPVPGAHPVPGVHPVRRPRIDFSLSIKPTMNPMEPYVWTDLGWLNPCLSVFQQRTNGQLAIRQGDLVFRPRDKESTHVLEAFSPTRFLGIALTSKALMFAGQKINFPVALGGALTTYNRSDDHLCPFETRNATMDRKCLEIMEGHNRTVGSLRETQRGHILSLGWSHRGSQADVIVYY